MNVYGRLLFKLVSAMLVLAFTQPAFAGEPRVSLGGGYNFYETDEEVRSGQLYEIKGGYQFNDKWSTDLGVGIMPHLDTNEFPDSRFALTHDALGVKVRLEGLYHFMGTTARGWEPFAAAGVGMNIYNRAMEDGSLDVLGGVGAGTFYNFKNNWFARADYRLELVGHDTEFNQNVLLSLGYRFGPNRDQSGMGEGDDFTGRAVDALSTVYFAFDSSALSSDAKSKLDANADWLKSNPGTAVQIQGHCDERGTVEYNLALGERRARSTYDYLRGLGVPADQMSTISFGEEVPAVEGHNEAAWAQNRRVEFKDAE